jgi:hypothetical protein
MCFPIIWLAYLRKTTQDFYRGIQTMDSDSKRDISEGNTTAKRCAQTFSLFLHYTNGTCSTAYLVDNSGIRRPQWPRGLRRGSAAVHLLGLWVWIPPWSWMPVSYEYCVLSGRGLCVGLITRPEESYQLWCVWVWFRSRRRRRRRRRT